VGLGPVVADPAQLVQQIRIQGKTYVPEIPTVKLAPLGFTKIPMEEPTVVEGETPFDEEETVAPPTFILAVEELKSAPPAKKRFGRLMSDLSDDTAASNLASSAAVFGEQADLGASTAASCKQFADNMKEFYSSLILETPALGTQALENVLDSLCVETANNCEKLQKDLTVQANEHMETVRSALKASDLTASQTLEELLQQSITEAHDLASSVLQKTREQSLSFLEVMNKLHNDTVTSVLRDAGAESF